MRTNCQMFCCDSSFISVIGGLISAHMLSGIAKIELEEGWPCNGPLLRLAERMADKLMPGKKPDDRYTKQS